IGRSSSEEFIHGRAMALPTPADVYGAVDLDAVPNELAIRGDEIPGIGARSRPGSRCSLGLNRHDVRGPAIQACDAQNGQSERCRNANFLFHVAAPPTPRPISGASSRSAVSMLNSA